MILLYPEHQQQPGHLHQEDPRLDTAMHHQGNPPGEVQVENRLK